MPEFSYTVVVTAESQEQADMVMQERIEFDEQYEMDGQGFDYSVEVADWKVAA